LSVEVASIIVNFTPYKNHFNQHVRRLQYALKEMNF